MMLSPPGRFSITTGLPQRCVSRSWIRRAPMSAPAPGPNGMMSRIGRCGHCVWACVGTAAAIGVAQMSAPRINERSNLRGMAFLPGSFL